MNAAAATQTPQMSRMPMPPPPQPVDPQMLFQAQETLKKPTWDDVIGRLRDDKLRSFTIDIETDSTIVADEETQKANVSEFTSNIGQFLGQMMPLVQQAPEFGPFAVAMLKYASRRFEAGREMETVIDETGDALLKRIANPPSPQADPKMQAAQAQVQASIAKGQAQVQVENMKAQADIQRDNAAAQSDVALRQAQAQADAQLETQKAQDHAALQAIKAMRHEGPQVPRIEER